jgi:hypothetical protein
LDSPLRRLAERSVEQFAARRGLAGILRGFDSRRLHESSFAGISGKPWGTIRSVIVDGLDQGLGELLDVPVGVDVARRLNRRMAEQLLNRLEVPGRVEEALAAGMPGLVYPLSRRDALGDDPGPVKASVPPVVEAVNTHGLVPEAVHTIPSFARDRLLTGEQVLVGLGLLLDDQLPEVVPDPSVRDGQVSNLSALRKDRHPLAVVIEVLELDALECPLRRP